MENKNQEICSHCKGSGTCKNVSESNSCDFCIAFYSNKVKSKTIKIVPCACCKGIGKRNLWHENQIEQSKIFGETPNASLTHFSVEKESVLKNVFDRRRLGITILIIIIMGLSIIGALIHYILKDNPNILTIIITPAFTLIASVAAAYVGGNKDSLSKQNKLRNS